MKAAVLSAWNQLEVNEVEAPVAQAGEVLIEVAYAGVCGSDVHIYQGTNPIARTPLIPGHEFMGRIAALGDNVSGFEVGQRVVAQPLVFCGDCEPCRSGVAHVCENLTVIGVNRDGAFAQFVTAPVDCLFPIPDALNDGTAALAEPFSIGMHAARRGALESRDNVLIIGAGPIGLYAALVCRHLGTQSIHLSEPNAQRREFAAEFGFDATDPASVQPSELQPDNAWGWNLVIETSGVAQGLEFASQAAAVRARIVTLGFPAANYNPYNITAGIVKELSLIGSRVCTRAEFADTLELLLQLQSGGGVNFSRLATPPRTLDQLDEAIGAVADARECAKILISP